MKKKFLTDSAVRIVATVAGPDLSFPRQVINLKLQQSESKVTIWDIKTIIEEIDVYNSIPLYLQHL